ncbi:MAG TPA: YbaK/EbsC family protein [Ktedonobacterales bacterium]|jgi:Cys-tRNA(Pro) deacylase|nr:YbaK/EbsC family protein [Ktedonobacterales bacterium]
MTAAAPRVAETLEQAGVETKVREFAESTRTAQEAAAAIGTTLGRIVKSLVFLSGDHAILALVSGENRVDTQRLGELTGGTIKRASAEEARAATGFSIGDVPPVGHLTKLVTYLDQDLMQFDEVWAAAGKTNTVFRITPMDLQRITGATVVDLAAR